MSQCVHVNEVMCMIMFEAEVFSLLPSFIEFP